MPTLTAPGRSLRNLVAIAAALVVAFGLTIGPAAAPADAASNRTWKRLANCESGGRWHINTGNGYYGGLQFSLPTWRAYHGRHFTNRPHRARRIVQIAVAERVLRNQGWGAWPACSSRLGLGPKQRRRDWGVGSWRHKGGHHHNAAGHRRGAHTHPHRSEYRF